ncbi:WD40 repeat [Geosmithia morbida]|uniref:WD40 repeat n=1 Tax=Geosmithia morbida TaxID=1094350 RepID=A0A9P5D345_9HYPO|nr:WD40 repeat [Geosmithia morbida]KAF4125793.1 WD40 repeat [Geosmithia morbida]
MATPSIQIDRILAAVPATNRGHPTQLSTDPKGRRIAYASGKSIFVRSIDDPSDSKEYTGHNSATTVARFSPSGFKVASGDASGILHVWEPDNIDSTSRKEYQIIAGRLNDVAWDGESQRVIAVGDGREQFGRCITADSGNSVGEIIGHAKSVNAVAMKPQRPFRAATVSDDGNMVFYHGTPYKFQEKVAAHRNFVMGAAYSPDGAALVTVGADKRIQLYDGKTGEPTRQIGEGEHTGSIFAASWSQDGTRLATASADRTVKLWDVEAGSVVQSWSFGDGPAAVSHQQVGVVIPHGRDDGLIISVNLDGDLSYLHEGKPEPVRVVQGHSRGITALGTGSADGAGPATSLWSGSFDGRVCHWDVGTGTPAAVDGQHHTNKVAHLAAHAGRTYTVGWDDVLRVVDESARAFLGDSESRLPAQPQDAAVSSDDGTVYVATSSGLAVYSAASKLVREHSLPFAPSSVAVSGSTLALGADSNSVKVYNAAGSGTSLEEVQTLTNPTGTISALAFSRDGSHLAAGNAAGKIYVYAAAGGWGLVSDRWSAHTARVTTIAWDPSGAYAASGSLDTNLFVWCLEKKLQGKRIKAANAHKDGVNGVVWIDGATLASGGGDAAVKIWKVKDLP